MNTVTHTTAQKLKETGWEKETERVWYNPYPLQTLGSPTFKDGLPRGLPAPTFSEIWEELPKTIGKFTYLWMTKQSIHYKNMSSLDVLFRIRHDAYSNITEAAAALWLMLKKEGLLDPK